MATVEIMHPGPRSGLLRNAHGELCPIPEGWALLEPGDPLVTRRVKATGPAWVVEEKVGRKTFSRGLYAPLALIEKVKAAALRERADPKYEQKLQAGRARREREQEAYVLTFEREVLAFLAFAPVHESAARELAKRISAHATPVGSGTVARTKRIEVDERAEAAVIAWMRHQTTAYDSMSIARVKGRRREVRRELAQRSRALLERYRKGLPVLADCPLQQALARKDGAGIAARVAERAAQASAKPAVAPKPADVGSQPTLRAPVRSSLVTRDSEMARASAPVATPKLAKLVETKGGAGATPSKSAPPLAKASDAKVSSAEDERKARMAAVRARLKR